MNMFCYYLISHTAETQSSLQLERTIYFHLCFLWYCNYYKLKSALAMTTTYPSSSTFNQFLFVNIHEWISLQFSAAIDWIILSTTVNDPIIAKGEVLFFLLFSLLHRLRHVREEIYEPETIVRAWPLFTVLRGTSAKTLYLSFRAFWTSKT